MSTAQALARRRILAAGLLTAALVPLSGCGRKKPARAQAIASGATVLALGDSLTAGVGASAETAYPAVLQRLTGWNIVNAGVSGDTSTGALQRLPMLLQQHRPALMIVSIGGNDFLRRQSASTTRANVRQICADAKAGGAQVLLVAIPELTVLATLGQLSDHAMYEDVANELQIPLHRKGWSGVLADAKLRSDQIHANAAGYELFTLGLVDTLKDTGLLAR